MGKIKNTKPNTQMFRTLAIAALLGMASTVKVTQNHSVVQHKLAQTK